MTPRDPAYARWLNALVLVGFGWLAILIELAPLGARASATPSPELLLCVAAFLSLRRPNSTPSALILLLGLASDVISGGPVGLGALTLLAAVEALRANREWLLRHSVIYEVLAIAALAIVMNVVKVVILTMAFVPSPALETLGLGVLATVGAYVAIAAFFRFVMRLRAEPLEARNLIRTSARAAR
ncbi:MAG: rod shape-determining protein MreD [Pseudomonadota bacterium]